MFLFYSINPILILAAVVPAIYLLIQVYRADRLEKEPGGLIVSLVLQGIIATFLAVVTELLGQRILDFFFRPESLAYRLILYFIVVALSEEGFKYWLLKKRTWRDPNFNCLFDGIVYAVSVGLGFSLWENIGYVLQYGLTTAILRAVTAIPGHASFGVFMGVFYGQAKRWQIRGDLKKSGLCLKLSLFFSVILHGTYDFIATASGGWGILVFLAFVILLFRGALQIVRDTSLNDRFFDGNT